MLGTAFSDTISDNGAVNWLWGGQGSDNVRGGGGGDGLRGMEGADMVWDGAEAGTFYICLGESGPTAGRRDTIEDFSESQGDRIDLSGFRTGADDWQLDLVGGDAFTGVRQVRAEISGGNTYVTASVDGGIDMWLKLKGVVTLGANDLFL